MKAPRFIQIVAAGTSSHYYNPPALFALTAEGQVYRWALGKDGKYRWYLCENPAEEAGT